MSLDSVSQRLAHARQLRGFSRRGLSLAAGVAQALVGIIERNPNANPQASTIASLAAALDVDPAWLLTGAGTEPQKESA